MIDQFGRRLTYLRVSLIDRCNLKCLYCRPERFFESMPAVETLSIDETADVIALFAELGIRKVRFTGGEPLLRKDAPRLVARVKSTPGIKEVVMSTNGVLLGQYAAALQEAGLDRVNVSLDTLDRKNFTRITGMDRLGPVLEGLRAAAACGLSPVKINVVLMKGYNDHEILDLVNFAVEGRMQIRFIEWMPTSAGILEERNSRFLSCEFAEGRIRERFDLAPDLSDPHAPARTYSIRGTDSKVGFISPLSKQFCSSCNRLRLKANGMLKTCLHGAEDLNIRDLLRGGMPRAQIQAQIREIVFGRPKEHFLNDTSVPHKDFVMTTLGG